jgi:hypothetical protein
VATGEGPAEGAHLQENRGEPSGPGEDPGAQRGPTNRGNSGGIREEAKKKVQKTEGTRR